MISKFEKIAYEVLNSRQQENYNYQKISAVLADYGFVTIKLSDDWNGADFIAQHISGETLLVQLKGRLAFDKKYLGKNLWICFRDANGWYLYPHDELLKRILAESNVSNTVSWSDRGIYNYPSLSRQQKLWLDAYKLT